MQSGVVYAAARCGRLEPDTVRYALLMLYAGLGGRAMVAAMLAWTATSVAGHALLWDEYLRREPAAPHRELATYLVDHGIHYARSDYWTAYAATFLAGEKVVITSNDTVRIAAYQDQVAAHRQEAVTIQRQPCADGGVEAVKGTYWICTPR